MYIIFKNGRKLLGDFIKREDAILYSDYAYYKWSTKEVIFIGKFTEKQKTKISKRLKGEVNE